MATSFQANAFQANAFEAEHIALYSRGFKAGARFMGGSKFGPADVGRPEDKGHRPDSIFRDSQFGPRRRR